jgi:zinc protease
LPGVRIFVKRNEIICLVAGFWLAIASAVSASPAAPRNPEPVTSVEGISEYRLANGLRVLLFPDASKPTVTVNVTYVVGSRNEGYGETGMAHLLEHMLFKGSKHHLNIPEEMRVHGARNNASTWLDRTNYFETTDASEANLRWALELEADRMVNSFVAKKDLDSEMTVVRNEFESGENNPTRVLFERVLSTAFLWHNYGKSTIGARSDIENVPIERLQAFYRNYYQPDNAVLLVAGKFDEAKTLAWIQEIFSAISRPTRVLQATYTREPVQDGEREVKLSRIGDVQELILAYHTPSAAHADSAALQLLVQILADTPSGRLHKALVESKKASSVGGNFFAQFEPGFLTLSAEVRTDASLEEARKTMLETVDRFSAATPTKEEVNRARTALLKEIDLTLNQSGRLGLELSEWIAAGDWRLFFLNRDRIKAVTPEDVRRVAAAYLKPANRTIGEFRPTAKPDRAEIPEAPSVAALVEGYKGNAALSAGEAFDPSPANVEARTVRRTLGNGMRLALLSKKTRGSTVVAALTLRFGDEVSLRGLSMPAEFASEMLMRGTTRHTRQQIQDEFDRLKARVSVSGGATQANVSVVTVGENLPEVLRLIAEIVREPAFPEKEFELLKQETLAGLEEQKSDPQALAGNAYSRHLNPYPKQDVRYVATPDEEIQEVKATGLEAAKRFHAEFYGAANSQMAVVGDFDARQVGDLVETLLGAWKSGRSFSRVPRLFFDPKPIDREIETPDKANAMFLAGENLEMRDDDPGYPAMILANSILGGGSGMSNSRLGNRIRVKEGLSYAVGSGFSVSPLDRAGTFTIYAICAPQNIGKVQSAALEEINRALKEGFTPEEVSDAKKSFLQGRQVSRAQDSELARTLSGDLFLGRTLLWDRDLEARIGELTREEVLASLQKTLVPGSLSFVRAGDFALKAPAKK